VYATARAGSNLVVGNLADTNALVGQYIAGSDYNIVEQFEFWDTSIVGDSDTISAVDLSVYGVQNSSDTDFIMNARLHDWGGTLTSADWVAGADLGAKTLLATYNTSSGFSIGAYNAFTENGTAFRDNINKLGNTSIVVSSSRHEGNNTPTGNEYMYFNSADPGGTTQDPKLVVTHTAPPTVMQDVLGMGVVPFDR
jgi:hypothetical protein